jgi:hypothetical protein
MTLEEPILIFILRISCSKESSPLRWLCLALIQLKGKTKESREWGVAQCGVCLEMGVPLYLYKSYGGASVYLWRGGTWCTISAWSHATARGSHGWGTLGRGRPPLGSDRSMIEPPRHHLCMAGLGLDMDQCPMVLCPFWVDLVGVSLVPLRKSASESAFWWIFPCICVCDLQNDILQIHVELG